MFCSDARACAKPRAGERQGCCGAGKRARVLFVALGIVVDVGGCGGGVLGAVVVGVVAC